MKYIIEARNIWELGQRANQEDSICPHLDAITESDRTFVVCDGMGGHDAGEVASQTVCHVLFEACQKMDDKFTEDDFNEALTKAYDALDEKDTGAEKKMGTTMTFLKLHDKGCFIAHIGDSRVYHVRPGKDVEDTEIIFQTRDHSLVNDLIKIGELTPEEAKHSKQKNVITRAMQPNMERRSRADIYESEDVRKGDYFLLCTDGVLEQMENENIKFIFSEMNGDIDRKREMLIDVTTENRDNHSAILVHILNVVPDETQDVESNMLMDESKTQGVLRRDKKGKSSEMALNTPKESFESQKDVISTTSRFLNIIIKIILISLAVGGLVYMCHRFGWLHWMQNAMGKY